MAEGRRTTETATEPNPALPSPTVESAPPQVTEEAAAVAPADVEVTNDEAGNWFLELSWAIKVRTLVIQ